MKNKGKNNWLKILLVGLGILVVGFFVGRNYFNRESIDGPESDSDQTEQTDVASDATRIAAVGDSITSYSFVSGEDDYPEQLQVMLGEDYAVENFGVSNYSVQSASDFPYETTDAFEDSLAFEPELVLIMLGTNDTKGVNWEGTEQFKSEYLELLQNYQDLPSVSRIILASPPPAFFDSVGVPGAINPDLIVDVRDTVEEIADENDLEFVDMYEKMSASSEHFPDGLHPDKEGSAELADIFYQQILQELN